MPKLPLKDLLQFLQLTRDMVQKLQVTKDAEAIQQKTLAEIDEFIDEVEDQLALEKQSPIQFNI
jgi:hypothetical protein